MTGMESPAKVGPIPGVFFTSAGIAALFVTIAIPFDEAVATHFGLLTGWVATSLGLGTLQLNSGLNYLVGALSSPLVQVGLIAVLTG